MNFLNEVARCKLQVINILKFELNSTEAKFVLHTLLLVNISSMGNNYLIVRVQGPFGSVMSSNVSSPECFRTGGKLTLRDAHIISLVTSGLS